MANASSTIDLHQDGASFRADLGQLVALKVNRLARWLPINAPDRAVAQWGNAVDDFMLEAQLLLRLFRNGSGSPEGAVAAEVGTLYLNTEASPTGSRVWYKATGTGSTGWSQVGGELEAGSVQIDRLEDIATARLLGRSTAGSGPVEQIAVGSGLSLSGGTLALASDLGGVGRRVLGRVTPIVAVTGTTSPTSILGGAINIPANTLTANGQSLLFELHGKNLSGAIGAWNFVLSLNGVTLAQDDGASHSSSAIPRRWVINLKITRLDATHATASMEYRYVVPAANPSTGAGDLNNTHAGGIFGTVDGGAAGLDWSAIQALDITIDPPSGLNEWDTEGGLLEAA